MGVENWRSQQHPWKERRQLCAVGCCFISGRARQPCLPHLCLWKHSELILPHQTNSCLSFRDLQPSMKCPQCRVHPSRRSQAVSAEQEQTGAPWCLPCPAHAAPTGKAQALSSIAWCGNQNTLSYLTGMYHWRLRGRATWKA